MSEQKLSQKEAVYQVVKKVLGDRFVEGHTDARDVIKEDKNIKAAIVAALYKRFESNQVRMSPHFGEKTQRQIFEYCRGLAHNWLMKDSRLNAGQKYTPSRGRPLSKEQGDIVYNLAQTAEDIIARQEDMYNKMKEHPMIKSSTLKVCDCGAVHTSNPNHHTNWCTTQH